MQNNLICVLNIVVIIHVFAIDLQYQLKQKCTLPSTTVPWVFLSLVLSKLIENLDIALNW